VYVHARLTRRNRRLTNAPSIDIQLRNRGCCSRAVELVLPSPIGDVYRPTAEFDFDGEPFPTI
jgi:hypothetical protein